MKRRAVIPGCLRSGDMGAAVIVILIRHDRKSDQGDQGGRDDDQDQSVKGGEADGACFFARHSVVLICQIQIVAGTY